MSLHNVAAVIHALLIDEDLRARFALDRIATICELMPQRSILTDVEIELFINADAQLWSWKSDVTGSRAH